MYLCVHGMVFIRVIPEMAVVIPFSYKHMKTGMGQKQEA